VIAGVYNGLSAIDRADLVEAVAYVPPHRVAADDEVVGYLLIALTLRH